MISLEQLAETIKGYKSLLVAKSISINNSEVFFYPLACFIEKHRKHIKLESLQIYI